MNITKKSTHLNILSIRKLMQDNVEEDMNGTYDEIFLYLSKMSYIVIMRVVKRNIISLFQYMHTSDQKWNPNLFCILSSHWVYLRQK